MNMYSKSFTLTKAASRARGDRLGKLFKLCEDQKTVSTNKLYTLLEELAESDNLDAIHFKKIAEYLPE